MDTDERMAMQRWIGALICLAVFAAIAYGGYVFAVKVAQAQVDEIEKSRPLDGIRKQIKEATDRPVADDQFFDELRRQR